MSTKPPSSALAPEHIVACATVAGITALFRALRYPVPDAPDLLPAPRLALARTPQGGIDAGYLLAQMGKGEGDPLTVTLFVVRSSADRTATIRATTQAWVRAVAGQHLLVFACQDAAGLFSQLVFVNPRRLTTGPQVRVKLHKLVVDRAHPTRHDLTTLNRLALTTRTITPAALFRQQCDAFDVEQVTKAFYTDYAALFQRAQERIKRDNPALPLVADEGKLHTFTQRLFGRLLFLYFLQKKGALNHQPDFITAWYNWAHQNNYNFYRVVLEDLFFDTLNKMRPNNMHARFQAVPYLNGGLFADDELDHRGIVYLDDDLFAPDQPTGILHFLNNHNFTVAEDTPLEVEVALDPEMMGKVLENLLAEGERKGSGTFYTPRPVVMFMCRQALARYLVQRVQGVQPETIGWLLDEAEAGEPARRDDGTPQVTPSTLPRHQRDALSRALDQVRVLDPAVGSGAFLLGMLALLVGVRRALFRVAGDRLDPHGGNVAGWKWDFIRDCLYGVDIKQEAIEIARQRLWLSLVVEADPFRMEPLPNLDYKMMDGDSLIETFAGVEIIPTREATGQQQASFAVMNPHSDIMADLRDLQARYFLTERDKPTQRQTLRVQIRATEQRLINVILDERDADLTERLKQVLHRLNMVHTKQETSELTRRREAITHAIAVHQEVRQAFRQGQSFPFFLFRLYFGSIFTEGDGFDIVIANPPYVRHEYIAPPTLATLKATYPAVQHGMADLYTYFYARALQLLRPGGTFAFVTSNKFFRAGYGKGLLRLLRERTTLHTLIDFGDAPVFDAAAYPCIVVADNAPPTPGHEYKALTTPPDFEYADLDNLDKTFAEDRLLMPQSAGVRPPATASDELVHKLLSLGTPLGQYVNGKILYGIKTGLNEAFVIDQATHDRLVAADPNSAELLKPYLRGRDVNRYHIIDAHQWLIRIETGWTSADIKSKQKKEDQEKDTVIGEKEAWEHLQKRYPAIASYLETYTDRARHRDDKGQFWWELRPCVYYSEFEKPKIISLRFGLKTGFVFDQQGYYCNDAIYTIASDKKWLTAVLNSSLCNLCLISICPSVQNGYSQFFVNKIEQLPIVEPPEEHQQRLADIVDELQALGGVGERAKDLEREADGIVYEVYGLSIEEQAEINIWHEERHRQLATPRNRSRQPRRDPIDDIPPPEAPMQHVPSIHDDHIPDHIDVAISFAGSDRALALTLARRIQAAGFVAYYDDDFPLSTWGQELPVVFDTIYRKRASHCVMLVSEAYLQSIWTNTERRSAVARFVRERGDNYILQVMVDAVLEVPGIPPTIGYQSLHHKTIEQIADDLIALLRAERDHAQSHGS